MTDRQCRFTGGGHSRTLCTNATALALNPQQDGHRTVINPLTYSAVTDASGYIAAVNAAHLCGFSDLRLPTVNELHGILNLGNSPALEIDLTAFPNTQVGKYGSSDLNDSGTTARTLRTAVVGSSGSGEASDEVRGTAFSVRLVRGGTPIQVARFSADTATYPGDAAGNLV